MTKSPWLRVRLTPEQKESRRAAAEAAGKAFSSYDLAEALPPRVPEFDSLIAWMLASPDSHVPFAECVDYPQTLPAARGAELARKPLRFDELPVHRKNLPTLYRRRNIFVEHGLCWRLAPISTPALPDEAEALERAFAPSAAEPPVRRRIAEREVLPEDWLSDATRGFLAPAGRFDPFFDGEGLRVFVASAAYVLAMKILDIRPGGVAPYQADIRFQCRYLGITSAAAAMDIVEKYHPLRQLTPRTRFGLEELLQAD